MRHLRAWTCALGAGLLAAALSACGAEAARGVEGAVVVEEAPVERLWVAPLPGDAGLRPRLRVEGEPLEVGLAGVLPDGCSGIHHVSSEADREAVRLRVWVGRPAGFCDRPGPRGFQVRTSLSGLAPGPRRLTAGDAADAVWVVPATARSAASCAPPVDGPAAIEVTEVGLPAATWPDGRVRLELGVRLQSACLAPAADVEVLDGRVRVTPAALDCGADALAPPCDAPLAAHLPVDLPPLGAGRWEIEVGGRVRGTLEVLEERLCRPAILAAEGAWLPPAPVPAGDAFEVSVEARAENGCALPGAPEATVGEGVVDVRLPAAVCAACSLPAGAAVAEVPLVAPEPGTWELRANGRGLGRLWVVDPAGCGPAGRLPPEAVVEVTVVGEAAVVAGDPVDLVVSGTAPWCPPKAAGLRVADGTLDLDLRGLECPGACREGWRRFASLPDGLTAGAWPVRLGETVVGEVRVVDAP